MAYGSVLTAVGQALALRDRRIEWLDCIDPGGVTCRMIAKFVGENPAYVDKATAQSGTDGPSAACCSFRSRLGEARPPGRCPLENAAN